MPDKPVVLVDPYPRKMAEIFAAADLARLHDLVDVLWGKDEPMPPEDAASALGDAAAIICDGWRYGDVLGRAPALRAIINVSGGFSPQLDYETCFARGIRVLSVAPAFGRPVAEMALGLALAASRQIVEGDRAMREGGEPYLHAGNVGTFLLFGKQVGFIGFGSLGRCLKPLLAPFDCRMAVYDPWLTPGYLRSQDVQPASLEEVMERSQVIFVLASPTSENAAMISRSLLERIQPGAVFVLISRAHVVDFDTLTEFVLAGRFRAAIDVFPQEPLDPAHPIRRASGAILSAHRAGAVQEGLWTIGEMVVDDLEAIIRGLPPRRLQPAEPETVARYARR